MDVPSKAVFKIFDVNTALKNHASALQAHAAVLETPGAISPEDSMQHIVNTLAGVVDAWEDFNKALDPEGWALAKVEHDKQA